MTSIHDDLKAALDELQQESADLDRVPGHELVRLFNSVRATTQAIRAAQRGDDYDAGEIRSGAGAIEDPLHPHTVATEQVAPTSAEVEARAEREPDPTVRANIRQSADAQAEAEQSTARRSSDSSSKSRAKK